MTEAASLLESERLLAGRKSALLSTVLFMKLINKTVVGVVV